MSLVDDLVGVIKDVADLTRTLERENAALRKQLATISKILHYPDCWDTAAYPDLESCIEEIRGACTTCEMKEAEK